MDLMMIIVVDVKKRITFIIIIQCILRLYRPVREICSTETNPPRVHTL